MVEAENEKLRCRLVAMGISLGVGLGLMAFKFYIYGMTGSSAILSDALESIINVVTSGFAFWSIGLAAKPPDADHPYGHGKVEYFSAGFEGAMIVVAALAILWEAFPRVLAPRELPNLGIGLVLLSVAGTVNLLLGLGLIRVGRRTDSLAVTADGKHVLTDVYTSVGVILGLILARFTGWYRLDGIVACLVAGNILYMGVTLVWESFARLMDTSDPGLLAQISQSIEENRKDMWVHVHKLRAWRSGNRIHVDFHLILPGDITLEAAYREISELERALKSSVPGLADALIHVEPCPDPSCGGCDDDGCSRIDESDTISS